MTNLDIVYSKAERHQFVSRDPYSQSCGFSSTSVWAPKSLQMVTAAMKLKDIYSLEGKL